MPRARKTLTGTPAQPAVPIAGQTYGMGVEQQRLQEAMPTPNANAPSVAPPAQPPTQVAPALYDHQGALAAASTLADQTGLLLAPTNRPNEPVTAGLSRGPGPGPEVLGMMQGSPTGDVLRRLAAATGDPSLAELAMKARA